MLVRAAGRGSALPGPLADPRHVAGQGADPRDRHRMAEIGGVERSEHVGDAGAGLGVRLVEQAGEGDGQPLADPRDRMAQGAVAPLREIGQVVAHPDDAHPRARRRAQAAQDRDQPGRGPGDPAQARGELGQALLAAADLGIVGADVDGDEQHVPAMVAQEGGRGGELRTAGVAADTAVHHRLGGLPGAPELYQPQRGASAPQLGVHEVRVTLRGLDAGAGRVGLDTPGQGVAQGKVIHRRGGLGGRGSGARRRHRDGQGDRDGAPQPEPRCRGQADPFGGLRLRFLMK